ncbi:DUF4359 domain-containing protein [Neobacillus sp. MM2021_6]|uniref:DUF4359 domain-containing protein n=1 Tax=Bacillaceae TaxID=186817 RepID=UPI001409C8D9|nr:MULTISPECIES: DUF4359 domain-containing protein [Bacillaceae]MBO0961658.1 DUF4359 domain-containing protein [Neobacillus sp. MM2021_6]NHC20576.1 DUF4359 domain-containing protein [Bacillus sp. MM2020_4]
MKRLSSIILSIFIIFVLSATNPERAEYLDWINHKTMDQSSNILKKGILSVAGKSIFDAGTTKSDYLVFSVYKTDFTDVGLGKVTTIGVFNQFIPLNKFEK